MFRDVCTEKLSIRNVKETKTFLSHNNTYLGYLGYLGAFAFFIPIIERVDTFHWKTLPIANQNAERSRELKDDIC